MPVNFSFPAPKALPGCKKTFPEVCSRVNSFNRVNISKPQQNPMTLNASRQVRVNNSSGSEAFSDCVASLIANKRLQHKSGTHHDSSAVSACLHKQSTGNISLKTTSFKSKTPKSVVSCPESLLSTKPKWNTATVIDKQKKTVFDIPTLPGKKKTWKDFVDKQFRATPAPPTTHKPSIPVAPKKRLSVRDLIKVKHLDPTEKAELREFELTEKVILQLSGAPSRFPKNSILSKEDEVIRKNRALVKRLEEIILREVAKRRSAL